MHVSGPLWGGGGVKVNCDSLKGRALRSENITESSESDTSLSRKAILWLSEDKTENLYFSKNSLYKHVYKACRFCGHNTPKPK